MKGVEIRKDHPLLKEGLTEQALRFVVALHREFNPVRKALLERRQALWERYKAGEKPDFLQETAFVRGGAWRVAEAPPGPPGGDHGPRGPQDDHQRLELGGQGLHGGL